MNTIESIEKEIMPVKRTINFQVGDTVKVHYKIVEGNRERVQVYEGVVIALDNKGMGKTFTVRRISYDVGGRAYFPHLFDEDRKDRGREKGQDQAREALLSARADRKVGQAPGEARKGDEGGHCPRREL